MHMCIFIFARTPHLFRKDRTEMSLIFGGTRDRWLSNRPNKIGRNPRPTSWTPTRPSPDTPTYVPPRLAHLDSLGRHALDPMRSIFRQDAFPRDRGSRAHGSENIIRRHHPYGHLATLALLLRGRVKKAVRLWGRLGPDECHFLPLR